MKIAIANQKGGVGKTTLAVHVAKYLATHGKTAILVDGDPQANATSWLLDGDTSDAGLFRLLVVGEPLGRVVRSVNGWGMGLLPGGRNKRGDDTASAMSYLLAAHKPFGFIASCLSPLDRVADYVLIDMAPSKAVGFAELLYCAHWVIVPTQLERFSLEGVMFMARTCAEIAQAHGRGPKLLGIVPNMVRWTKEHHAQMGALTRLFGSTVWPPISLTTKVTEAASFGTTMFDHEPGHKVTRALVQIGQRVIENTRK